MEETLEALNKIGNTKSSSEIVKCLMDHALENIEVLPILYIYISIYFTSYCI